MKAIYQGRRHFVVSRTESGVWLEQLAPHGSSSPRVHVSADDADLILQPTDEDMDIADAYECGEISAYEYADGRTYPPGREIGRRRRPRIIQFRAGGH